MSGRLRLAVVLALAACSGGSTDCPVDATCNSIPDEACRAIHSSSCAAPDASVATCSAGMKAGCRTENDWSAVEQFEACVYHQALCVSSAALQACVTDAGVTGNCSTAVRGQLGM